MEYNYYGDAYVVQRNAITNLLGEKFVPLYDNKEKLIDLIESVKPDVIHFEEFCESFISEEILLRIFSPDRNYYICETCHSSTTSPTSKLFRPDKLIMVSPWIAKKFEVLGIDTEILEFPIEDLKPDKIGSLKRLELDPEKIHVLNVGLFTPGKNQKECMDLARSLQEDERLQFHFVGNTAPNFRDYWEPLLTDLPKNCKVWGERSDVDSFYQACDLFLFTSSLELNPLCLKEALSWKLPTMCRRLATYLDTYDSNPLVSYLVDDPDTNLQMLKLKLSL